jgi:hypothetical protein
MMCVELVPSLAAFEDILTYELERKRIESSDRLESTPIHVIWKSVGYEKLHVFVQLIEYDEQFNWDKVKLKDCYHHQFNQFSIYTGPIEDTYLTHDVTILMTGLELDFTQRDGVLNITIYEGIKDDHVKIPELFHLER